VLSLTYMKKSLFYIFTFLPFLVGAQDLPFNTQVFLNPYFYNPAYAAQETRTTVNLLYRNQWSGIQNSPKTFGISLTKVFSKKIPFGINLYNDKSGVLSSSNILATGGYMAKFDEEHYISFALSAGASFNTIDFTAIKDYNDPAINDALQNNIGLDGNFGLLYHYERFNFGVALPKIFQQKRITTKSFETGNISPLNYVLANVSYRWEVVEDILEIEPFIIAHYYKITPLQMEGLLTFYLKDFIWLGAAYKQDFGIAGYLGFGVGDNFKFGYAYEAFTAADIALPNFTHEIQMSIILGKKERKQYSIYQRRQTMINTMRSQNAQTQQKTYTVENDPFLHKQPEQKPKVETKPEQKPKVETKPQQEVKTKEKQETSLEDKYLKEFENATANDLLKKETKTTETKTTTKKVEGEIVKPKETTVQPKETIKPKETTTTQPKETVKPKETTVQPKETVKPKETTVQPKETTKPKETVAPKETTEKPKETGKAKDEIDEFDYESLLDKVEKKPKETKEAIDETKEEFDLEAFLEKATEEIETRDEKGMYIGPTIVTKGTNLLELEKGYYVVVGTFDSYRDAEEYSDQLFIQGFFTKFGYISQTTDYYVYIFTTPDDYQECTDTMERLKVLRHFKEIWVLTVK